jgi:hypothetical protein
MGAHLHVSLDRVKTLLEAGWLTKDGNPLVGMRTGTRHEDGRLGD